MLPRTSYGSENDWPIVILGDYPRSTAEADKENVTEMQERSTNHQILPSRGEDTRDSCEKFILHPLRCFNCTVCISATVAVYFETAVRIRRMLLKRDRVNRPLFPTVEGNTLISMGLRKFYPRGLSSKTSSLFVQEYKEPTSANYISGFAPLGSLVTMLCQQELLRAKFPTSCFTCINIILFNGNQITNDHNFVLGRRRNRVLQHNCSSTAFEAGYQSRKRFPCWVPLSDEEQSCLQNDQLALRCSNPCRCRIRRQYLGCTMKIFSGDPTRHHVAENVKSGDPLTLVIGIDKQEMFGLKISDCMVETVWVGRSSFDLSMMKRCPIDGEIMGQFTYSEGQNAKQRSIFRLINFLTHCQRLLPMQRETVYQTWRRMLRYAAIFATRISRRKSYREIRRPKMSLWAVLIATIEVYSGLYVNEASDLGRESELTDDVFRERTISTKRTAHLHITKEASQWNCYRRVDSHDRCGSRHLGSTLLRDTKTFRL
ncbi:hypothetical protein KQX54_018735 [Cotesia glomerata]|uniref:Uncharacterized protein n=1 Tax=Cotesia glomerata TaxID=32391 RepID=A0AAV7I6I4_COTGL|nr:hypothetical protein KQX54_018735 [Cotesia glomerata]